MRSDTVIIDSAYSIKNRRFFKQQESLPLAKHDYGYLRNNIVTGKYKPHFTIN